MDFLLALVIAFSFFTALPMPIIDWTPRRMRFVPVWLPAVGLAVGACLWGLYLLLAASRLSPVLSAVMLALFPLLATGGVHMEGLMDTSDAYFSRRDIPKKLEIMKDSRVGAFAVMACASALLLRFGLFSQALSNKPFVPAALLLIPVFSRVFLSSMFYLFPYARSEGLARTFGSDPDRRLLIPLLCVLAAACVAVWLLAGVKYLAVPGVCLCYYVFYFFSSKKQFGGITGDVMGAFLELSELLMLAVAALI